MIALVPTDVDAQRIAVDGGEEPDQLHITLMYLGEAAMLPPELRMSLVDAIEQATRELPTVIGKIFSVNVFNPESGESIVAAASGQEPCVTWGLSGELLTNAHKLVVPTVRDVFAMYMLQPYQQHDPWIPHITAAYIAEDDEVDLAPFTTVLGPVTFDRIRLAFGDEVYDVPLGNSASNCGCTDAVTATFDPHQPRDSHGRWTSHGTDNVGSLSKALSTDKFDSRVSSAVTGRDALDAAPVGLPGKPKPIEQKTIGGVPTLRVMSALSAYNSPDGYKYINNGLRNAKGDVSKLEGEPGQYAKWRTDRVREIVDSLDAGMSESRLKSDVVSYRGLKGDPRNVFGDAWSDDDDLTGLTWSDDAYSSTSTNEEVSLESFTSPGGVFMKILVPHGSNAMSIDWSASESEILLSRDSKFRVVRDNGMQEGLRFLDVEVIPNE